MTLKILISHNLTVFYAQGDRVVQRDISNITNIDDVLCLCDRNGIKGFRTLGGTERWFDFDLLTVRRAIPTGNPIVEYHGDGHYSFRYEGKYARANNINGIDFVVEQRNLWETFKLLEVNVFLAAIHVTNHRWVVGDEIVTLDIRQSNFEHVSFGGKHIPTEQFFSEAASAGEFPRFIFFDGWKVNEAYLYNPLIILVVFGFGVTLKQYSECIRGIDSCARYEGTILIISNVEADHLIGLAPARLQDRIRVIAMHGSDQLDYVGARLAIFNTSFLEGVMYFCGVWF